MNVDGVRDLELNASSSVRDGNHQVWESENIKQLKVIRASAATLNELAIWMYTSACILRGEKRMRIKNRAGDSLIAHLAQTTMHYVCVWKVQIASNIDSLFRLLAIYS